MPHLQFEFNRPLTDEQRTELTGWTAEQYAETMETGTGHVAVTIHELDATALSLGRAPDGGHVGVLNADIRAGRSFQQRHTLANAVIERLGKQFEIPPEHCYVIYTEHPGEDFLLEEGALDSWSDAEADRGSG